MDTFINAMYPVNGETTHTEETTIQVEEHDTALIVMTAVMSALFLGLSVCMFVCHRKASPDEADEFEVRRSLVDLEQEGEARAHEGL
jgi:preprotein translocase subunit SecG